MIVPLLPVEGDAVGAETQVQIVALKGAQEAQSERVSETRQDLREIRGDIKELDGRMDADERALVELRGEVALLAASVSGLVEQNKALLAECRQLRETLDAIRIEVIKVGEAPPNPLAVIGGLSGRVKGAAAGGGVAGLVGAVYALGKTLGWWE